MLKFIPLNNNVLIKKTEVGKTVKTDGFIVNYVSETQTIPEGLVLEKDSCIKTISNGDNIVFIPQNAYDFILNGEQCLIINYDSILGKLDK